MSPMKTTASPTVLDRIAARSLQRMDARTVEPRSLGEAAAALVDINVYTASALASATVAYLRRRRTAGH